MEYIIKLENFEGPFELLLELIKKREMNIFDLQISQITQDYLLSLESMQAKDIELTSDFMEVASLLLQIKTRLLLPAEKQEEDPRQELVKQLLDYKEYKEAAEKLRELKEIENKFFKRQKIEVVKKKKKGTLQDIVRSYQEIFMKKFKTKNQPLDRLTEHLTRFKFTIEEQIEHLKSRLTENKRLNIEDYFSSINDKEEMVVTFGALLELVKVQFVNILLEDDGTVSIERKVEKNG